MLDGRMRGRSSYCGTRTNVQWTSSIHIYKIFVFTRAYSVERGGLARSPHCKEPQDRLAGFIAGAVGDRVVYLKIVETGRNSNNAER